MIRFLSDAVRRPCPLWWRYGWSWGSDVDVRGPARASAPAAGSPFESRATATCQPTLRGPRTAQHHAQQHGLGCQRRT